MKRQIGTLLLHIAAFLFGMALCQLVLGAEPRKPVLPDDVQVTPEVIELGRQLFFEPRLSSTGTVSCSTCHQAAKGWSDGLRVSTGATGQTSRNSPTIINSAFKGLQFHDGRAVTLLGQAREPLRSVIETGNSDERRAFGRLMGTGYDQRFQEVFGRQLNVRDGLAAIAAFESTIVSTDAPIDRAVRWRFNEAAGRNEYNILPAVDWVFDDKERRGFDLFFSKGCINCHQGEDYRTEEFVNNGMGYYSGFVGDRGRADIAGGRPRNFSVPTLREVQLTSPFGHAGHLPSLRMVVRHYSNPPPDPFRDARVQPMSLSAEDEDSLVAFLTTAFAGRNYPMVASPELPAGRAVVATNQPLGQQVIQQQTGRFGLLRRRR